MAFIQIQRSRKWLVKTSRLMGIVSICACVACFTIVSGCGSSKPMSGLQGKVTYKGEAVADAKVQVQSSATGAAGVGKTDASGSYRIETPLPPGAYSVVVAPWEVPPPAPLPKGYVAPDNPKIPKKYRTAATSGLKWEAKAGNNEFNIPMAD